MLLIKQSDLKPILEIAKTPLSINISTSQSLQKLDNSISLSDVIFMRRKVEEGGRNIWLLSYPARLVRLRMPRVDHLTTIIKPLYRHLQTTIGNLASYLKSSLFVSKFPIC